jgi:putative ATP-binding cassette transporter
MENIVNVSYIASGIIALIAILYLGMVSIQIIKKKRNIEVSKKKVYNYFFGFLALVPVIVCFYYVPIAFYDSEFWLNTEQYLYQQEAIIFLAIVVVSFYALTRATMFVPHDNIYYNIAPLLLIISPIPGIASAITVMIINVYITEEINEAKYLLLFFAVTTFIYIVTIRLTKRVTANLGVIIAHKLNMQIVKKTLKFSFREYEKVEDGKIYTLLNDDVHSIFFFSQSAMHMYTNAITAILVTIYMYTLNLTSSLMLLGVTALILGILATMAGSLKRTGHRARVLREQYTTIISGLIYGFKELVLHGVKREKYLLETKESSEDSYRALQKNINVGISASIFSELSFTIAVGVSCLLFPLIFDFEKNMTTSYVIAVLFLWGPFNALISGVPQIANTQVSWKRIKDFLGRAEEENSNKVIDQIEKKIDTVESIEVENCHFNYSGEEEEIVYGIGPIDFKAYAGELIFLIGGNGSGKTTFLKMLVGLYQPTSGRILINGQELNSRELGECFSVIYSDYYLFKKIYDLKKHRLEQVYEWLEILGLSKKVKIEEGAFSTINLSQGQRKRLAIIKSYLEDRPVYFFDEVAADLDPEFRSFFYNHLLMKIKDEGKILIIISHDDKYFNLADKIYKMDMGKIFLLEKNSVEKELTF